MRTYSSAWTATATLVLACALLARCARDDDDDNKPYKFGFNIDKYQHRLEEKDTKGLVKGEFGFVTGDGVYHETAYATDERGDFKILGMRSYFVGLPGLDLPDITKGSRPAPQKVAPAPAAAPPPLQPLDLSGVMGCSGCTIPVRAPAPALVNGPGPSAGSSGPFSRPTSDFGGPGAGGAPSNAGGLEGDGGDGSGGRPRPAYIAVANAPSTNKVGGFTADDMRALLYRFNYTVGFHGHHEVGDRAGHKQGGYHFNGRDGFERAVSYTANEFGFQPNITLRELGAESQATPRQDTEKGAEFGLKGFEFVWFNAPNRGAETRGKSEPSWMNTLAALAQKQLL